MAVESRRLRGLVARVGVPTSEPNPRTLINVVIPHTTVPLFRGAAGTYRELIGTAELSVTDEGVMAEMVLPPYLAAELLRDDAELHAHIEGVGGEAISEAIDADAGQYRITLDGMEIRTIYCGPGAPAWNDLWLEEQPK